jgi:4-hydroxy-3-polyprenylbenzoate decarboxylase
VSQSHERPARIVVAMAGSDGLPYGVGVLERLRATAVETHLVLADTAELGLGAELDSVRGLADHVYAQGNQAARISSGSFLTRGMVVAPCDGGSLSAIVLGLARNLVYRAADVTLKERRPLVLGLTPATLAAVDRELLARAGQIPGLTLAELDGPLDSAVLRLLEPLGNPA